MHFASGTWELYAETFGDAADPPVVLLHGAGNSMMSWDAELCEALADRGRLVVRLDSRDAGRSGRSGDAGPSYSMRDLARDVVALLDALGLPAATLAGVSGGAVTAQIAAVEHPTRMSGLVLISTTPGGDDLPGPVEGAFASGPSTMPTTSRGSCATRSTSSPRGWSAIASRRSVCPRSSCTAPPTPSSRSSTAVPSPPRSPARRSSRSTASATARCRATSGRGSSS